MSDYDSDDEGQQELRDDFFGPEETFVSTHQEELLDCYQDMQDKLREGGHPILDRCTFPQFCAFVYELSERISANGRALQPSFDPIPWGLIDEDQGGAPEPSDIAFHRRVLKKDTWVHVHKSALIAAYRDLMRALSPRLEFEERYIGNFVDFCFDKSSMTLKTPI